MIPKTRPGWSFAAFAALVIAALFGPRLAKAQQPVEFKAADGVSIYGSYYAAKNSTRPMILLFHQAGANRYEYATIAPRLAALGFNCLAIDQRWGGEMFGHGNETVQKLGHEETVENKLADLEADLAAALAWAKQKDPGKGFILWGSSYSASLVFVEAAKHPRSVVGLLAFSPGEYFDRHPRLVRHAAANVHVPVFVTSENDPERFSDATRIFNAVASRAKVHYVARYAVHGSATLRADRNPQGAAANWQAVVNFLKRFQK